MKTAKLLPTIVLLVITLLTPLRQPPTADTAETNSASVSAPQVDAAYIGYKGCICHNKVQITKWIKGPHVSAYETLLNDQSKAIATEMGLTLEPHEAPECLRCHTTAFGVPASRLGKKMKMKDGIQCEACHGPGSEYKTKSIMEEIHNAPVDQKAEVGAKYGFVISDVAQCLTCHNEESPTYRGFDKDGYFEIIDHMNPPVDKFDGD